MKKKPIRSSNKHIDRNTINIKKRSIFFTNFPYSIYISILSIIISSIAAFYTYKSYDINYKQYKDDQLIVLNGKFENDTTLYVSSIDEKKFIKGKLFFPSSITNESVEINNDGFVRGMGSFLLKLKNIISKKYKYKKDYISISDIRIPIVIYSYYASNGNSYTDFSLYTIEAMFSISDEGLNGIHIYYQGLVFLGRYHGSLKNIPEKLDIIMDKKYIYIPLQEP